MEQLGYQWKDFHEIWHLVFFEKTAKKVQVCLNCDKNNGQFTYGRLYIYDYSKIPLTRINCDGKPPDKQKIRIIRFFFANRLHWQFEVQLLLFSVCTRV